MMPGRSTINKIVLDPVLSESVVRQEIDVVRVAWEDYHRHAERIPSGLGSEEREKAFRGLDRKLFAHWGFEEVLLRVWDQHPHLQARVSKLYLKQAETDREEGAFVGDSSAVLLGLRTHRFRDLNRLRRFLHHELVRASDMLDESFGYAADLPTNSLFPEALIRDRYRVLWDAYIDGRLEKRGLAPLCSREERWKEYSACYPRVSEAEAIRRFDALWAGHGFGHREFLALASQITADDSGASPGSPCPLCKFPTFAWASPSGLDGSTVADVRRDFPDWSPTQGACDRCAESYRTPGGVAA